MSINYRNFLSAAFVILFFERVDAQDAGKYIAAGNSGIQYEGRVGMSKDGAAEIYWPGSSCKMKFSGTTVKAVLRDERGNNYYNVIIDSGRIDVLRLDTAKREYTLASNLPEGEHTVELFRRTGWTSGVTRFYGFELSPGSEILDLPGKTRMIEFYGNSITVGAAIEDYVYAEGDTTDTNNYLSYAAITARHFNAKYSCIASSGIGLMVSWGSLVMPDIYDRLNPDDSASKWDFSKATPDIVVVNLMQNDNALVNLPDHEQFKRKFGVKAPTEDFIIASYRQFIQTLRRQYPKSSFICALGSMDAVRPGSPWPGYIEKAVASLKDKAIYTHFFTYIDRPDHPNVSEHEQMAKSLEKFIEEHINW